MKKAILVLASLFLAIGVFAQKQGQNPEEKAKKMTEHMKTNLSLTDEQTKAVELINTDFALQKAEVEKGNHEAHVALKNNYVKELSAVLTPEQMEKMKEMRKEQKGKRMQKGGPKG